ncbi:hypothetical protein ORV05_14635 [Amycolatopsis cynarae]|uniref:Uncharacterized protein n=1 Tax=Amycolatopsis cynarae TaxID=2995223 RepID=A0ABY7BCH4_9PSEU|nr:hypothetical protein [Amycolatopsis sp. HUAS 11-8]WAL68947.1 hypothetical protein ORV05_14635 [Amycolatopsis sp. HUAS 11-8]
MTRTDWRRSLLRTGQPARRRPGLAVVTALIAVLAYGGAVGLISGMLDLGDEIEARLPFRSPVFGGAALAVVVGVPMTVAAWLAARRDTRSSIAAVIAGSLLVGWIAVEIGFVQSYSWIQPVFAFAGLGVAYAGMRDFGSA